MSKKWLALFLIVALLVTFGGQAMAAGKDDWAARNDRTNVNMNDNTLNPTTRDGDGMVDNRGINDNNRIRDNNTGMRGMNDGFRPTAAANETNWGWLGLLGLIGLAGMFGRNRAEGERR